MHVNSSLTFTSLIQYAAFKTIDISIFTKFCDYVEHMASYLNRVDHHFGSKERSTALFLPVLLTGCTWREALSTCVFQSDFGFVLNCAFRKSGLFRVRNLGGVKGYVGLGELNYGSKIAMLMITCVGTLIRLICRKLQN